MLCYVYDSFGLLSIALIMAKHNHTITIAIGAWFHHKIHVLSQEVVIHSSFKIIRVPTPTATLFLISLFCLVALLYIDRYIFVQNPTSHIHITLSLFLFSVLFLLTATF